MWQRRPWNERDLAIVPAVRMNDVAVFVRPSDLLVCGDEPLYKALRREPAYR
jgi:hypothetical protein